MKSLIRGSVSPFQEFRSDESGAMMVIGLFFAFFLVGALYYILGIGQAVLYRERLQDAADTAAFAGAVFKAPRDEFHRPDQHRDGGAVYLGCLDDAVLRVPRAHRARVRVQRYLSHSLRAMGVRVGCHR